jgi:hypothetical protein
MSRVHRVLVTGSRNWPFPERVWEKLDAEATRAWQSGLAMVVVHGACPTGGDKDAEDWVKRRKLTGWPVSSEPHPANWTSLGAKAGPLRNNHMVSLGADVVLAFVLDESKGASGCLKAARKAELLVDVTTAASGALTAS